MKIFSSQQIRNWDFYTIANEPVSSIDLMERAATVCHDWLLNNLDHQSHFIIFCGTGNNGGDGLAIARMLYHTKLSVEIFILPAEKRSNDFIINLEKLITENIPHQFINAEKALALIKPEYIVIDALFGTGLNKPLEGLPAQIVNHINQSDARIVSIDMPSGLLADKTSKGNTIIKTSITLSFQTNKLAFMMAENELFIGDVHLLNIGLHQKFYNQSSSQFSTIDKDLIKPVYKPRKNNSHKYDYGHALLYTGSKNMMGASILCATACLRSGAGLVTVYTEEDSTAIIHTALPEAITTTENDLEKLWNKKNAIAIGPGLELSSSNSDKLQQLIKHFKGPLVIDATALALLAEFPEYLLQRQQNPAILTPHTGEFEKLFGKTNNDFERIELALHKASTLNCYIILKGHHTFVATPDGKGFFNTTGNPGMATAGSGDALTGMVTGLLAQGYTQLQACLLSVYLHGLAGDIAAERFSQEALITGDIIDCFGEALKQL